MQGAWRTATFVAKHEDCSQRAPQDPRHAVGLERGLMMVSLCMQHIINVYLVTQIKIIIEWIVM